jgi:hypothetical protein
MIAVDYRRGNSTVKVMIPVPERVHNGEHLLIVHVIVPLRGRELTREEFNRVNSFFKTLSKDRS